MATDAGPLGSILSTNNTSSQQQQSFGSYSIAEAKAAMQAAKTAPAATPPAGSGVSISLGGQISSNQPISQNANNFANALGSQGAGHSYTGGGVITGAITNNPLSPSPPPSPIPPITPPRTTDMIGPSAPPSPVQVAQSQAAMQRASAVAEAAAAHGLDVNSYKNSNLFYLEQTPQGQESVLANTRGSDYANALRAAEMTGVNFGKTNQQERLDIARDVMNNGSLNIRESTPTLAGSDAAARQQITFGKSRQQQPPIPSEDASLQQDFALFRQMDKDYAGRPPPMLNTRRDYYTGSLLDSSLDVPDALKLNAEPLSSSRQQQGQSQQQPVRLEDIDNTTPLFGSMTARDIATERVKGYDTEYQKAVQEYNKATAENVGRGYAAFKANQAIEGANSGAPSAYRLTRTDISALRAGGVTNANKLQGQIDKTLSAQKQQNKQAESGLVIDLRDSDATLFDKNLSNLRVSPNDKTASPFIIETKDANGNIQKSVIANVVTTPDPTNPFMVKVESKVVPVGEPPKQIEKLGQVAVRQVEKPSGNGFLDFGKGFAAPFQNLVQGGADLVTGQQHEAKTEVEGDLFATGIKAATDLSRGQKLTVGQDLEQIGKNILDNPAYAAGNIAASAIMWLGPGEASKAIRGMSETSKAIQGTNKVLSAAEQAAKSSGIEVKAVQPLNVIASKSGEAIETPLREGPLGITYINKPLSIIPKVTQVSRVVQIPGTSKLVAIPKSIGFEAPVTAAGKKITVPVLKSANAYDVLGDAGASVGYYTPKGDKLAIFTEPKTAEEFGKVVKQGIKQPESITYFDAKSGEVTGLDLGSRISNLANPTRELAGKSADRISVNEATGLKSINQPSATSQMTADQLDRLAQSVDPSLYNTKGAEKIFSGSTEARGGVDEFGRIVSSSGQAKQAGRLDIGDVFTFSGKDAAKAASAASKRTQQIEDANKALGDISFSQGGKKGMKPFEGLSAPKDNGNPLEALSAFKGTDELREAARVSARNNDVLRVANDASKASNKTLGLGGGASLFAAKNSLGLGGKTGAENSRSLVGNGSQEDIDTIYLTRPKTSGGSGVKQFIDSFTTNKPQTSSSTKDNSVLNDLLNMGLTNPQKSRNDTMPISVLGKNLINIPGQTPGEKTELIPMQTPKTTPMQTPKVTMDLLSVPTPQPTIPQPPTPRNPKPELPKQMGDIFGMKSMSGGSQGLRKGLTIWKVYNPLTGQYE